VKVGEVIPAFYPGGRAFQQLPLLNFFLALRGREGETDEAVEPHDGDQMAA